MPRRLTPSPAADVAAALSAYDAGTADRDVLRLLVKHYLALLQAEAPGAAVEVRVPPFAAVQVIEGVRHTRGTPPAVVELGAEAWIEAALGRTSWADLLADGAARASGERTDLAPYLPLGLPLGDG